MTLNPNGRTAKIKGQIINDLQMSGVVLVIHPYEDGKGFGLHVYGAHGPIRDFDFDEHGEMCGAGTAFSGSIDEVDGVETGGWAAEDFTRCPDCGSVAIAYESEQTELETGERLVRNTAQCTACEAMVENDVKTIPKLPETREEMEAMLQSLADDAEEQGYGTGEVIIFEPDADE